MGHRRAKPDRFNNQEKNSGDSRSNRYYESSENVRRDRQADYSGNANSSGDNRRERQSSYSSGPGNRQESPSGNPRRERGTGPSYKYYSKLPSYAREVGPADDKKREKSNEVPHTYDGTGFRKENEIRNFKTQPSYARAEKSLPSYGKRDRQNDPWQKDSNSRNARQDDYAHGNQDIESAYAKNDLIRRKGKAASRRDFRDIDLRAIARDAMKRYGFTADFPKPVIAQVNSLDPSAPDKAKQARDLRGLLWSSIDNADSMDLDQIEYCEQGERGEIHVKVAIADVDAYVPKDSPADLHAYDNTTSVYTGIEIFPMLPDRLSKDLSSLPVGENRLAMVVEFTVLPNGSVKQGEIYRAVVRNKAKLVYETLGDWLEGKGAMPKVVEIVPGLVEQIKIQDKASLLLGGYRTKQGALELETLQARPIIQDEKVLGLVVIEANRARHIIENFMIAANGTMSGYLENAGISTIQRVVRTPKSWSEIVEFAKGRGTKLPAIPNARALTVFLAQQKKLDPLRFPDLSLTIVKLLGSGEYVMYDKNKPIGHFCLAVTSYTHATAPNRRYVDLIIQRLLKAALKGMKPPYGKTELAQIAAWCTEMEMASKKAERFMTKAEAALLLSDKIGEVFDALITGSSEKGIYARLLDPPVEGKLMFGASGLKVGLKVRVRLVNLNPEKGFIDFEIA